MTIFGGLALGSVIASPRSAPTPSRAERPPAARAIYRLPRYAPRSRDAITLFQSATRGAGVPIEWAADPALHAILEKESDGWVGRPNYHFGDLAKLEARERWPEVWAAIRAGTWRTILGEPHRSGPRAKQSSATGLGQLTSTNVPRYYPSGLDGIGVALEEAIGMLRYIADRYGSPAKAWARYGRGQEGY